MKFSMQRYKVDTSFSTCTIYLPSCSYNTFMAQIIAAKLVTLFKHVADQTQHDETD